VRLTEKGHNLRDRLAIMLRNQVAMLSEQSITDDDLEAVCGTLRSIERSWTNANAPLRLPS
jgi:hypothetical protein